MEATESISKGCFIFKNSKSKQAGVKSNINLFSNLPWYQCYKESWKGIEDKIKKLLHRTYMNVLQDVIEFMRQTHTDCDSLPTAVLITGINQPDHAEQINSLARELRNQVTPHVAILFARGCLSIKSAVENMVMQFLTENEELELPNSLRKYQYNLLVLKSWYENNYAHKHSMSPTKKQKTKPSTKPFVVILPDFENFNATVLQDFILLLSGYSNSIPFVLLFGVATSISTVHKTLPHHITSKMFLQIFSSQSSRETLNQILEKVLLDPSCPFHLSGSSLKLLVDVFMFYDFSVEGFLNSFKYIMLHHYSNLHAAIVCNNDFIDSRALKEYLTPDDVEEIRRLPSFRYLVESQNDYQMRIDLLLKDKAVFHRIPELISNIQDYLICFHLNLKILFEMVHDLPQNPLGNKLHELYISAMSTNIIEETNFKETMQLLQFLSRAEFTEKINNILHILEEQRLKIKNSRALKVLSNIYNQLNELNQTNVIENAIEEISIDLSNMNRNQMREMLMECSSKQRKTNSQYDAVKKSIIDFTIECFSNYLHPPTTSLPLYELFIFTDHESVKQHIVGSPRATLHTALNSPSCYLQCSCCATDVKDEIISTMPDICIGYKLHLECGRLINLYDWLHAFRHVTSTVANGTSDAEAEEDTIEIEPEIQARFTSMVSELQHLGFIKSSNKKRDHVTRLTW